MRPLRVHQVVRNGVQATVLNDQVVVGDVLLLDSGDKVVADGVAISSQVCGGRDAGRQAQGMLMLDGRWGRQLPTWLACRRSSVPWHLPPAAPANHCHG